MDEYLLDLQYHKGASMVAPFLPTILKDSGFSSVTVGWIFTVIPIAVFFIKPFLGAVGDKIKNKKLYLISLMIVGSSALFLAQYVLPKPTASGVDCSALTVEGKPSNQLLNESLSTCQIIFNHASKGSDIINEPNVTHLIFDFVSCQVNQPQELCSRIKLFSEKDLDILCNTKDKNFTISLSEVKCPDAMLSQSLNFCDIVLNRQFWLVLLTIGISRIAVQTTSSFNDSVCFNLLGDKPEKYGVQQMFLGIGRGIAALISSFLVDVMSQGKNYKDHSIAFYLMLGVCFFNLLLVFYMPVKITPKSKKIVKDIAKALQDPNISMFLFFCLLNGFYHTSIARFLFWVIEDIDESAGSKNKDWVKTLQGLMAMIQSYVGEVPFMFLSGWILKKTGHQNIITIVLFTYSVRFFLYTAISNPWYILPVEVLQGVTAGLFQASMAIYAKQIAPVGTECTVQSLISATYSGAGSSLGSLVTGYSLQAVGYSKTYIVMAASAVIFGILWLFRTCIFLQWSYNLQLVLGNEIHNDGTNSSQVAKVDSNPGNLVENTKV